MSSYQCFPAGKDLLTCMELVSLLFWIAPNKTWGRIETFLVELYHPVEMVLGCAARSPHFLSGGN